MTNTIVCFSLNAPPLNNAEAFCTARFISALSQQGIKIHLITINHPQQLDESIVDELLDKNITITKLILPKQSQFKSFFRRLKHLFWGDYSEYTDFFIKEIKNILLSYNNPILLTRGWPPASNVVGYYLTKYCTKWIAHFGDPYPGIGIYSKKTLILKYTDKKWAKKIFDRSDLITVTCRNAIKHFNITLKKDYSNKIHVAYHIGYPAISYNKEANILSNEIINITHVGYWSYIRYMKEVIQEFALASKEWNEFNLIQFGEIERNNEFIKTLNAYSWFNIKSNIISSPRDSSNILSNSFINIVIDQNDNLTYCPYLASKFVYAVWSGRPIIAIGQSDCEMSKLANEYGGIYFVNIRKENELYNTLMQIKNTKEDDLVYPNEKLKELFHPENVAHQLIERVNSK